MYEDYYFLFAEYIASDLEHNDFLLCINSKREKLSPHKSLISHYINTLCFNNSILLN